MDFYIKNSKKNMTMTLPITPEKYEIEYKNDIETVRLTNFGDVNIPTHHTPITLSIEGLFSINENHYLNKQTLLNAMQDTMDYVNVILNWINSKDIVRVVITKDFKARLDLDFYIESIQYSEDGETVGDIKYSMIFREYRPLNVKTTNNTNTIVRTSNKKTITSNSKQTYIVQNGDYLKKISRKFYGTSSKWETIYIANKAVIGNNPNLIKVGQRLVV